ncbi:hypothetical protein CEXT_72381 [Caerostris extrusa]|uniref:Uncharacterized protein n=1 Tax=Caerostris extrusa TaxID=172846 RepID=A0AAV4M8Y2_CAEEX|nr:hypothetical protein CEXT_72381 [Caerostris extrusa]
MWISTPVLTSSAIECSIGHTCTSSPVSIRREPSFERLQNFRGGSASLLDSFEPALPPNEVAEAGCC